MGSSALEGETVSLFLLYIVYLSLFPVMFQYLHLLLGHTYTCTHISGYFGNELGKFR